MSRKKLPKGRIHIPVDDISMQLLENDIKELQSYNSRRKLSEDAGLADFSEDLEAPSEKDKSSFSRRRPAYKSRLPDFDYSKARTEIENIKDTLMQDAMEENSREGSSDFTTGVAESEQNPPGDFFSPAQPPGDSDVEAVLPSHSLRKETSNHRTHSQEGKYSPSLEVSQNKGETMMASLAESAVPGKDTMSENIKADFEKAMDGYKRKESQAHHATLENTKSKTKSRFKPKSDSPGYKSQRRPGKNDKDFAEAMAHLKSNIKAEQQKSKVHEKGQHTLQKELPLDQAPPVPYLDRGPNREPNASRDYLPAKGESKQDQEQALDKGTSQEAGPLPEGDTRYLEEENTAAGTNKPTFEVDDGEVRREKVTTKPKTRKGSKVMYATAVRPNDTYWPAESRMVAKSNALEHRRPTNVSMILDEGADSIDIPITGQSTWRKLIHGRRDVVMSGSVVAGVGLLIIIASIIYMIMNRKKRLAANKNNNKLYRRFGTFQERTRLRPPDHSLFSVSSEDDTSDEDVAHTYTRSRKSNR